jgi:hypothetical protein
MLQSLAYDLKFSGRMLRKNPVITAVAIIIIALGTGAVSTIFSIANAIALRPLPGVAHASELIVPERLKPNGETISASYVYYRHLATNALSVNLAAWSAIPLTVSTGGAAVAPLGNIVSGNYFDVLGVRPALGRFFVGDEVTVPSMYPVIVISYDFWQRQFSGDTAAIGRTVLVNGSRFTVVGVTPPEFRGLYPVLRTDVWAPLMMLAQLRARGRLENAGSAWLDLVGRIAPTRSRARAQAELTALTTQFATTTMSGEPSEWKAFAAVKVS